MTALSENPFPGLRPFEAEWSHLFFGREGQVDALLARLQGSRFVGVVGTSGSGKSSLVRAGLVPALRRGYLAPAGARWRDITFRPGLDPMKSLARAILDASSRETPNEWQKPEAIRELLDVSSFGLTEALRRFPVEDSTNWLIVVDQFEELFRSESSVEAQAVEERAAFVQLLLTTAEQQTVQAYVVLTMRSDYVGECARFRGLPEALNESQYLVPRLTREQMRDAIEGPVAVQDGTIAPRLVQTLLNDIGDAPDDLPLLQHLLMRLWDISAEDRAAGRPIGLNHYTDARIGGLRSALNLHAEAVLAELTASELPIAKRIFQRLSEKTSGNREVRRIASLQQLAEVAVPETHVDIPAAWRPDLVKQVLKPFAMEGRSFVVLTPQGDVDISHETLLRQWTRLHGWVDEEARSRDQYLRLIDAAGRWDEKVISRGGWRRRRGSLLQRLELNEALAWWRAQAPSRSWASRYEQGVLAKDRDGHFDSVVRFLTRSRWRRNALRWAGAAAAVAIVAASLAYWRQQRKFADQALVQSLITLSEREKASDECHQQEEKVSDRRCQTMLSVLLLAEAFARAPNDDTRHALGQAVQPSWLELARDPRGMGPIALSPPNGSMLAAVGRDNSITLTRVGAVAPIATIARGAVVSAIAFSPDGKTLAAAGWDGNVEIIRAADGQRLDPLAVGGIIAAVAYSSQGTLFAVSTDGDKDQYGVVHIFSTADWKQLATVTYGGKVSALAFSPDESLLLTGSDDGTARLLEARTGKERSRVTSNRKVIERGRPARNPAVTTVAFSADGKLFATGGEDQMAKVTSVGGKEIVRVNCGGAVIKLAFSAQGDFLAALSADRQVQIANTSTGEVDGLPFNGAIRALAFTVEGYMAVASDDGTQMIEIATGRELARSDAGVTSVTLSPDGRRVASAGVNGARVFQLIPSVDLTAMNDQALLDWTCALAPRALNSDERMAYLGAEAARGCPAR